MEEIKQAVLVLLRAGINITAIQQSLIRVSDELKSAGVYMQAIKDSDKAP